jgi:hypothetical protein
MGMLSSKWSGKPDLVCFTPSLSGGLRPPLTTLNKVTNPSQGEIIKKIHHVDACATGTVSSASSASSISSDSSGMASGISSSRLRMRRLEIAYALVIHRDKAETMKILAMPRPAPEMSYLYIN